MLIEFLQIISILIDGKFFLQWGGSVFYYFHTVTSFISISGLINAYPAAITGMLITVDMLLLVLAVLTIVAIQYGSELLNTSQVEKISAKIMGFAMLLIKTLLQISLFYLILSGCTSQGDDRQLNMGLSLALIILLLPFLLYVTFIFSDLNPFSSLIFAGESHTFRIINTIIKLSLVVYAVLDTLRTAEL